MQAAYDSKNPGFKSVGRNLKNLIIVFNMINSVTPHILKLTYVQR